MSRDDRYPSSEGRTNPAPEGSTVECCACDRTAKSFVVLRWGPARVSDTENHPACSRHTQIYAEQFTRFLAHMGTKEKFTKQKAEA